jgi:hypothetical protein
MELQRFHKLGAQQGEIPAMQTQKSRQHVGEMNEEERAAKRQRKTKKTSTKNSVPGAKVVADDKGIKTTRE